MRERGLVVEVVSDSVAAIERVNLKRPIHRHNRTEKTKNIRKNIRHRKWGSVIVTKVKSHTSVCQILSSPAYCGNQKADQIARLVRFNKLNISEYFATEMDVEGLNESYEQVSE